MLAVLEVVRKTTDFLAGRGVESPRLNAELLVGHALGLRRMQLYLQFERLLTEADLARVRPLVRRRGLHEPVQYILGTVEFCGLQLRVDRRALIPRPETEQLVEQIAGACVAAPERILDLGTGTGALALALARGFPAAAVVATDLSEQALELARENAVATGMAGRVTFQTSDWFDALAGERFDLIVANPPYLSTAQTLAAPGEVRNFEPRCALEAGADGLADLRRIIAGVAPFLRPGGLLALETGVGQHAQLLEWLLNAGCQNCDSRADFARRERFLLARF